MARQIIVPDPDDRDDRQHPHNLPHAHDAIAQQPQPPFDEGTAVELVAVESLTVTDSPRTDGEDPQHTRLLAEFEGQLPPILVHRATGRVLDGVHRLRAAALNGQELIEVRYFEGSEADAFVQAVRANVTHGLPLSLADRRAAARRIITSHPHWSDRAIASVTAIAAHTVSAVRRECASPDGAEVERRIGLDGRTRPLNSATGRRIASEIIAAHPNASLREIARAAGISPTTARDVRLRMGRGAPTNQGGPRRPEPATPSSARANDRYPVLDRASVVDSLKHDPSLRFTDNGRALLRWLLPRAAGTAGWRQVVDRVPPHCQYLLARFARQCSEDWRQVAEHLDEQVASMS